MIGKNPGRECLGIPLPQWGKRQGDTLTPALSLRRRERERKNRPFPDQG